MKYRCILFVMGFWGFTAPVASGQTPLADSFEIRLLPGFTHEQRFGIDSIVGSLAHQDGREIQYEIGLLPRPDGARTGGSYENRALKAAEDKRFRLREQTVGALKFYVAQSDSGMIVSTASPKRGINFNCKAQTPGEVADALLMVLSLTLQQPKAEPSPSPNTAPPSASGKISPR